MNIRLRAIIACLVFFALFGRGQSEPLTIRTSTIDLHSEDPQIVTVGRLKYQGGLNLTSPHPRFGGLSGLSVSAEGGILVAVTDGGDWVKLTPVVSSNGRLRDIGGAQISRMLGLNGKPLRKKRDSDAESLVP